MAKRIILAGLLGGIAMFAWSSIAHMALPLGNAGIKEISNEQILLATMRATIGETSGLYMFPGFGLGPDATHQQKSAAMSQYEQKLASNPSGILIYQPAGAKAMTPGQLVVEFFTELVESLLAVLLLAQTRLTGFGSRLAFVTAIGIVAAITTNIPYWNWYGFPVTYTSAYMTTEIVGFVIAGLVAAAMLKNQPAHNMGRAITAA